MNDTISALPVGPDPLAETVRSVSRIRIRAPLPRRKRVAAYARVSTDKDSMLHSLEAQVNYYSSLIDSHPEWEYRGVYADEGLTGTKANRPEFQRLLRDCREGKIDLILVKSVSRFARNTVVLLEAVRELKRLNVDVYFEEQNIHSLSGSGELMLTIMASFAQEESKSVSDNCLWRIREKFEKGEVTGFLIYGYKYQAGRLEVIPEEAAVVRRIFEMYMEGNGVDAIAKALNDEHIPSPRGVHWYPSAIQAMLRSEKYKGCLLLQKTFYEDHLSKRQRKNRGEREQYQVENAHEAIVSADDFQEVQAEIARRAAKTSPPAEKGMHLFTGKLTCGLCGKEFAWKANSGNPIWICKTFLFRRKEGCPARRISERVLVPILSSVLGVTEADLPGELGRVENITVYPDGRLLITADDATVEMPWENPSRAASWTPVMRAQAALDVGKRYQK